jgi:transketolase
MRNAFVKTLTESAREDCNLILLTADLGFGFFEEFEKNFPSQFMNVGIAEQAMTGIAAGLALEGNTIFTYSIANFATLRCLEQIRNDACYHELNVNIVASGGGFSYGQLGMSHHATEDLAIMRALPNIDVCAPATTYEVECITKILCKRPGVGYLRLDKTSEPESNEEIPFIFGRMRQFRAGSDITLISIGGILTESIRAAELLSEKGIEARILSCHSLKPLDGDAIKLAATETGGIVTIEEHSIVGGLGSAVAEFCMENYPPKKFLRIGLNDIYSATVGDQKYLRKEYEMDAESIVKKVTNLLVGHKEN